MAQMSYTDLRQNLARAMDEVIESRAPLLITRQGGQGNVVMIAEAEFEGWQETVHLLRSPTMARRLVGAVAAADAGRTTERDLAPTPAPPAAPRRKA